MDAPGGEAQTDFPPSGCLHQLLCHSNGLLDEVLKDSKSQAECCVLHAGVHFPTDCDSHQIIWIIYFRTVVLTLTAG